MRPLRGVAPWLVVLATACSVYDESLLARRDSISNTGGGANEGGDSGLGGTNGGSGAAAGNHTGGAPIAGTGGTTVEGGAAGSDGEGGVGGVGGSDAGTGGTDSGGTGTGGTGTGGTTGGTGTGGTSGGAKATGGTGTGGSTGGTSGGAGTTGGASTGGTTGGTGSGGSSGNCAGKLSGGLCWYLGALGDSCEATCGSHDSVNAAMTPVLGTAAQGGSLAECRTIANLFNTLPVFLGVRDDGLGLGCHVWEAEVYWLQEPDFTEDAGHVKAQIFCACNR